MVSNSRRIRNSKGFTLVEVIVVAVIVAVLALVGIQLYQGYVQQSRQSAANNLAAQAASFLQTGVNALNQDSAIAKADLLNSTSGPWTFDLGTTATGDSANPTTSNIVSFSCPANAEVNKNDEGEVWAVIGGVSSVRGRYFYIPQEGSGDGDGGGAE